MAFTGDVRKYEREYLLFCNFFCPSEGVELRCEESVFIDDLVVEEDLNYVCRALVVCNLVAFREVGHYGGDGTDVLYSCDCPYFEEP